MIRHSEATSNRCINPEVNCMRCAACIREWKKSECGGHLVNVSGPLLLRFPEHVSSKISLKQS